MYAVSGARSVIACRKRLRVLLPLLVGALLAACASGGGTGAGYRDDATTPSTTLLVENNSWGPVTVYISTGGKPWRLGAIDGFNRWSFSLDKLRSSIETGDVHLVALAGTAFRSEPFALPVGRTTVWTIENTIAMSHVAVR
jgi:hypothetical protein